MAEDKKKVDYKPPIHKAQKNRKRQLYERLAIGAAAAGVCLLAGCSIFFAGKALRNRGQDVSADSTVPAKEAAAQAEAESESAQLASSLAASVEASEAESREAERQAAINEVIDSYAKLGIVQVSGYLNIRKGAEQQAQVIGKLPGNSACEILEELEGWYKIRSGGIEGYVSSQYVLTGEEAKTAARDYVTERAVVTVGSLNIRTEPSMDADIVGKCLEGERYEIVDETDGWYQIPGGYIAADYANRQLCLNEARKLDLKAMVLTYYDKPGVSNVTSYLNIREGAGEKEKVIAKLPSYAGCEILEELDGWYKIRSGKITGYVKSDYILTGDQAREAAMEHAQLMAVVSTDRLNARTEPKMDAKIWTQISNNERYQVVSQLDGWVQIEFDESSDDEEGGGEATTAFVASEYVEVRYALSEAIKFSPAEENASLRSRIVNYAMQFLGNPYVWGGTSLTRGADCSGFTMSVLKNFGISLPHYSGDQAKRGKRINSSQMRPGDLIFYGNSSGRINHVAMYIGNGQIIHAASRKSGIKISTWNYRTPLRIVDVIGD
ncbi:MAG: SH3 domain-containing protein [Lachnospiraceae bacterium]|nr:SH3 domain-containing protein [Lachnospiraceae bacterium]